ncbi:aminotransferase class I/II-fold pyridoxal phosphate-dependent enzyme [Paenibacillus sp. 79R4]|uniref:aminotransferase class I/II-fold pyridoxal phosphate-dependent enzyme n=1 Tax=Paenibacillus sp. 79R4 TaxID=2212847 RepID=UPI0015BD6E97|nr:PLP-dependent aminotransferase family protein [Paenibacillus sp. 79R4]
MERWLEQTISQLPEIFRSDVEGLIRDGDFISFAGSSAGELSSLNAPLARIVDELGLPGGNKHVAGREPEIKRPQRSGSADHGAARASEIDGAIRSGTDRTSEIDGGIRSGVDRARETDGEVKSGADKARESDEVVKAGEDKASRIDKVVKPGADRARGIDGGIRSGADKASEIDEVVKSRTKEIGQIDEAAKSEAEAVKRLLEWLGSAYRKAEGGHRAAEAEDRLLLVDSAAEALELAICALLKPGDAVVVESPTSPEALWALRRRGAVPVPVQCDRDGMLPDDLRRQLRAAKPALVYVTPLHSTGPPGAVWSQQRMLALLEQCDRHRVPIVEDGTACGVLGSARTAAGRGGAGTASVRAASDSFFSLCLNQAKWRRTGVVLLDSFERALFPSLPLAWLRGNTAMPARHAAARTEAGLSPASNQTCLMLGRLLTDDRFSIMKFTAAVLDELNARRIYMKELLTDTEWRKAEVHEPGSGLFLWVRLPEGISSEALLKASMLEGVAFTPGARCYAALEEWKQPPITEGDWIRLNYAAYPAMGIAEGIARIEDALAEFTARS